MGRHKSPQNRQRHRSRSNDRKKPTRRLDKPELIQDFKEENEYRNDSRNRSSKYSHGRNRLSNPVILPSEEPSSRLAEPKIVKDEDLSGSPDEKPVSHKRSKERSPHDFDVKPVGFKNYNEKKKDRVTANFGLSGKLAEDTNMYNGVLIKYNEPSDARKPTEYWRLYPFKGKEALPVLHIHRQSGFLIGRDRKIADIPMDHPSISKQHAVLQFRHVRGLTRLYIIDLESGNGTYLNNNLINPKCYYELKETDMIKFGYSSREYVVMTNETEIID